MGDEEKLPLSEELRERVTLQAQLTAMEERMAEERVEFMEELDERSKKIENREGRLRAAERERDELKSKLDGVRKLAALRAEITKDQGQPGEAESWRKLLEILK